MRPSVLSLRFAAQLTASPRDTCVFFVVVHDSQAALPETETAGPVATAPKK